MNSPFFLQIYQSQNSYLYMVLLATIASMANDLSCCLVLAKSVNIIKYLGVKSNSLHPYHIVFPTFGSLKPLHF